MDISITEAKQQEVRDLFKTNALTEYDFSRDLQMIRLVNTSNTEVLGSENVTQWEEKQDLLIKWVKDRHVFVKETIEVGKKSLDKFFQLEGFLEGNILDIGGGWGLYREWWESGNLYIVHDPGVERVEHGPHAAHLEVYDRAFNLPAIFVEGFGEKLPYKDKVFDTCLIASALDHCVDPQRVLSEAARCLKKEGTILVIQDFPDENNKAPHRSFVSRITNALKNPRYLKSAVYQRLFWSTQGDPHLQHFEREDLERLFTKAGFHDLRMCFIPEIHGLYAFKAKHNNKIMNK